MSEKKEWKNESKNPLCAMFCVAEKDMVLLDRHKVNLEGMFYDFYQKFQGYPLWSVSSKVIPVSELEATPMKIANEYIKACKEEQAKSEGDLYAIQLGFDIDSSG